MAMRNQKIDPTTLAVCWNKFDSLCDEIGEKVLFATQSFVMANVRDLGQVFLDSEGRIVSVACYITPHIFVANVAVKNMIKKFEGDLHYDDFIVGNDPYIIASGHLPDWTFLRPVIYKDEVIGFFQLRGHMADTGGFTPGGYSPGAYDIIAEGLNIPPFKILNRGELNKDVWELILRNVRNPKQVAMDNMLINGAMKLAEAEIVRLCDKYGAETVKACMREIQDAGEKAARAEIAKMKDGVHYGESCTDWDGTTDKPIWIRCKLTKKGDELIFDLSESDPQAAFVNSPIGNTEMSVMNAFYATIDPAVPKNDGSMWRACHLITKKGTAVDPEYPATVGASAISVGSIITEACQIALAEAWPEKAQGGWGRHCGPIIMGFDSRVIDPRTGKIKTYWSETFAHDGSGGARKGFDGWQGVACWIFCACMIRFDMEVYETLFPSMVTRYEVMQDWEGAGEFRGGPGISTEIAAMTKEGDPTFVATGNTDGMVMGPWGVNGGGAPPTLDMWIFSPNGEKRVLRSMDYQVLRPGERILTMASGGGGWGDPLNRDVYRVRKDVRERLVSIKRAREVYGVVIDPETFEIKMGETEKLRKERKAETSKKP
jgi:N-methylhydantoinase B